MNSRLLSLLLTLLFLAVNVFASYRFYNMNSFKMLMVLGGLALLLPVYYYHYPRFYFSKSSLHSAIFAMSPIILTFFGFIYSWGGNNYNLFYELPAFCMCAIWMMMVRETYRDQKNLDILFIGMALLLVYVLVYAWMQGEQGKWANETILKATFGNRNYFIGFMLQLFPLFLAMGFFLFDKENRFKVSRWIYRAAALIAFGTILLCKSRAGTLLAFGIIFVLSFAHFYLKASFRQRKIIILSFCGVACLPLVLYFSLYLFGEQLSKQSFLKHYASEMFKCGEGASQGTLEEVDCAAPVGPNDYIRYYFSDLFNYEGWFDRIHSFTAAWNSFKASPLIGWGLGSSYNLYFLFVPPDSRLIMDQRSYNHVHSEPLEVLQEGGILSFLALLFFWGFVFYQGGKMLLRPDTSNEKKALVAGLLACFLAYNIHSVVSLTPRMMVVRLPLFLNIGLFFSLLKFDYFCHKKGDKCWPSTLLPLFLLLVSMITYIPWAKKQANHVKLLSMGKLSERNIPFYRASLESDDVYSTSLLAGIFFQLNMLPEAKRALEKTQKLIPHYRNIDYQEGIYYLKMRNADKAREAFETMQIYDRYHKSTNRLLGQIVIDQHDQEAWLDQFAILNKVLFRESKFLDKKSDRTQRSGIQ